MKKLLIPVLIIILIIGGGGAAYKYFFGPKIVEITMTKSVDDKGRPTKPTNTFTSKDTVYLSAKGKKFAIKKATVVWYKGEVSTQNRFKTEENIEISNAGYFNAKLSVSEGLEEGEYGVTIYNGSNDIIEKMVKFQVKN